MLPTSKPLVNNTDYPCQFFLIHTLASPRLEHDICSCFFVSRVVAEEGDDVGPLGHDWLSFVTFPALIHLA